MVENENNNNQGNTEEAAPKRRGRLFGGRRARSAEPRDAVTAQPEQQASGRQVPEQQGPEQQAPEHDASVDVEVEVAAAATAEPDDVSTLTGDLPVMAATDEGSALTATDEPHPEEQAPGAQVPAEQPPGEQGPEAQAPEAQTPAEQDAAERAPFVPVALTTTSLIFHAPVLPELPERFVRGGRPELPAEDEYDDHDHGQEHDQPTGRRRSRRRGGRQDEDQQQPQQRRREPELITEPQKIKGSTRLEAKKQRRRDGRDAGRRRTVITEDEFLARRESVDRQMIVRSSTDRIEIGVLEDGVLAEHYVTKSHNVSLIGNVYLGKVQNVLPSMEAAFVDIGRGRNAVLYSGEVDWDSVETGNQPRRIELALKPGDKVLVQVTKDPVGHKGARLTSQISLPGRYLVYVPNGSMNGISRKLPDTERTRLKKILKEVLPEHAGVIVRTAAEGATEDQLTRDVQRLTSQWEAIQKKVAGGHAPVLLHSEPDLLVKIVRDVFNEDFTKLIIDGESAHAVIDEYLSAVAPDLKDRVETYDGPDSFEEHRLNEQIEKALDRKVWLPSGGSLVIDRTEAMTVVDVNTGKFVGSGGNLEETVTKNNLEAAEEIVRQLRLRDIGGIIVVDFIDMVLESNRDLVLRRLVECLSRDRTKHQVAEVTSLGLVQMTRKKIGVGLQESFAEVNAKVNDNTGESSPRGSSSRGRKGRNGGGNGSSNGGNGNGGSGSGSTGNGNGNGGQTHTQAHQLTDDVKNALSRIAASTIAHEDAASSSAEPIVIELPEGTATTEAPATRTQAVAAHESASEGSSAEAEQPTSSRRRRGSRRATSATAEASTADVRTITVAETPVADAQTPAARAREAVIETAAEHGVEAERAAEAPTAPTSRRVSTSAPVAPSDAPVAILDIPVAAARREPRRVSTEAAESILDSVLQALPEPKQPGQGRSRSRRVSSGSISAPASQGDGSSADGDGPVILGR